MSEQIIVDGELLDHLITTIAANTSSVHELRDEARNENVKRDKRIRWSKIVSTVAVFVGVLGILVGTVGLNAATTASTAADKANLALTANAVTRAAALQATCEGFEAFTNALIATSPPSVSDEARAVQQAKIDDFKRDLEIRLEALHCDLHLVPAR